MLLRRSDNFANMFEDSKCRGEDREHRTEDPHVALRFTAWPLSCDPGVVHRVMTLDHDGWIRAARRAVAGVTAQEVGDAFLASLTSRRLDPRSTVASYALTWYPVTWP
jgi:hypothetical protein